MRSSGLLLGAVSLALSGCSTLASINWSAVCPWCQASSVMEITDQGVGKITGATALSAAAINEALDDNYRLRSGMKTEKGKIVRYFEALKGDNVALVVEGDKGAVKRIEVRDDRIATASGVKVGTSFSQIYRKAFGNCQKAADDERHAIECQAEDSQHIRYLFSGEWRGPAELMPSDDSLKNWQVSKIIWRR